MEPNKPEYKWVFGTHLGWLSDRSREQRGTVSPTIRSALGNARPGLCHLYGYQKDRLVVVKDLTQELWAFARKYNVTPYLKEDADNAAFRACDQYAQAKEVFEETMWKVIKKVMKGLENEQGSKDRPARPARRHRAS